jgi:recombinational DNA repair ATPase RecF
MTDTIDIRIEGRYRSISDLEWLNVPPFAVITGVNGSGKSRLLEVIARHMVQRPASTQHRPAPRSAVRAFIDGASCERGDVFHTYDEWIMPAQGEASERQIREAIENLHRQMTQDNVQALQAGIPWFL